MARWLSWLERRPVTAEVDGSNPFRVVFLLYFAGRYTIWGLSSAGRASALQAEGHRFEPCRPHSSYDLPESANNKNMDGFPSGQRGQTVNLLQIASVVRIHLHPFQCFVDKALKMFYNIILARGGAVWKLVGLITRRS